MSVVVWALLFCQGNPSTSQLCHVKTLIRSHDYWTVYLKLTTIKGHVKMWCFAIFEGVGDQKSQYLVWPPFASSVNWMLQQPSGWLVSQDLGGVSQKHLWRRLVVEKWSFNSRATALMDIPAVSMSDPHSQNMTSVALCYSRIVPFREASYCGQPKAQYSNHAA